MTTKIITAALAFFTTFGFSSLLMQFALNKPSPQTSVYSERAYSNPTNKKVLRFLQQDIKNGRERMQNLSLSEWEYVPPFTKSALAEYSKAVSDYAAKSGNMDDSVLPPDLRAAWREHMQAWQDYSEFLNALENLSEQDAKEISVNGLYAEKEAEISSTWYRVLEIAGDNYNAFPAGAY